MRTVILLVILVAASATETAALLKQLKPARQSPFADYFFGLLELKQNDKVDEIAQVVKGVLDKLIAAQGAEDAEHSKQATDFENRIKELENTLEQIEAELTAVNQLLGDLATDLAALQQTLSFQTKQLQGLTQQVFILNDNYSFEEKLQANKRADTLRILNAVKEVLRFLGESLLNGSSLIEKDRALTKLKETLGAKHPIALLVQMTQEFDEAAARKVVSKLEEMETRLEDALKKIDEESLKQAETLNNIRAQLDDNFDRLNSDKQAYQQQADAKANDLAIAQRRQSELNTNQDETSQILQQNRLSQSTNLANYNTRRGQRLEEIGIVQSAYDMLKQHAEQSQN